jgi:hypothetical protein
MKKIDVLDNTIRVLTQDDANALAFREKLSIAKSLQAIGVNAIELPAVQCEKEDKIIYRTIAESVQTTVAIPVEDSEESIACAYACVQNAKSRRLQVELPVSTVQMEYSYHLKAPKMLQQISATVKAAAACGVEVEFIAKDATRAEEGFLEQCAVAAKESGASIITLCDDNGEYFPEEFAQLVKKVKAACDIKVYVQPSNALKLAPAIFTECVKAGADGVKTATCKKALSVETVAAIMRAKSATLGAECTLDTTVVNKTVQDIKDVCKKGIEEEKTSLSATLSLDENATLKDIENEVTVLLAGHVAERMILGEYITGACSDISRAATRLQFLITDCAAYGYEATPFSVQTRFHEDVVANDIKCQANALLIEKMEEFDRFAELLIGKGYSIFEAIVGNLMEKQTLTRDELFEILINYGTDIQVA